MKGTVVKARGRRQRRSTTACAVPPAGTAAVADAALEKLTTRVAPEEGQQQRGRKVFAGLAPGREARNETDSREEAAEEGREGGEEAHALVHPSLPSSPSSAYSSSSSSSSSSSVTTTSSSSSAASFSCSSCFPSFPLLRPARPMVPAFLDGRHGKVSPMPSAAQPDASSPLPAPLCLVDSPSEPGLRTSRHADGSLVPVPEVYCCPFLHFSSFLSISFLMIYCLQLKAYSSFLLPTFFLLPY